MLHYHFFQLRSRKTILSDTSQTPKELAPASVTLQTGEHHARSHWTLFRNRLFVNVVKLDAVYGIRVDPNSVTVSLEGEGNGV